MQTNPCAPYPNPRCPYPFPSIPDDCLDVQGLPHLLPRPARRLCGSSCKVRSGPSLRTLLVEPGEAVRPWVEANRSTAQNGGVWQLRPRTAYSRPSHLQPCGQRKTAHPTPLSPHSEVLLPSRPPPKLFVDSMPFFTQPPNLHYYRKKDGSLEIFEPETLASHSYSIKKQLCHVTTQRHPNCFGKNTAG